MCISYPTFIYLVFPDMAGVIAAIQNGVGVIGVANKVAKIISTRALYDDKMGSFGTMMAAIDGCVENGAKSKCRILIPFLLLGHVLEFHMCSHQFSSFLLCSPPLQSLCSLLDAKIAIIMASTTISGK